jgi:hypothetical protein
MDDKCIDMALDSNNANTTAAIQKTRRGLPVSFTLQKVSKDRQDSST